MSEVNVRQATEDDIDWLVEQMYFMYHDPHNFGMYQVPKDEFIRKSIREIMKFHVFIVAEYMGEMAGFIYGKIMELDNMPGERVINNGMWYVHPDFRSRSVGADLVHALVECAKCIDGISYVFMNLASTTKVSDNTMSRLGFKPYEKTFIRRL